MDQTPPSGERFAIVTGGAGGLGRAFCRRLAEAGFTIAVVDIDLAEAAETQRQIAAAKGTGRIEMCDVTEPAAWRDLAGRLRADWPRLDLLVNNAGMFGSGFVGGLDLPAAERLIRLNLLSVVYGCDAIAPWLAESAELPECRPRIINIASAFAHLGPPGMAVYSASKAGVVAFSETLYGELLPRGVGVTVVCPGVMPTPFIKGASFDSPAYARLTESYVRQSTLSPDHVAAAALRGARRGALYVVEGRRDRWFWRLKRLAPTSLLRAVARQVRKELKRQA